MNGIIIPAYDKALIGRAHSLGLEVTIATEPTVAYEKTLILGADTPPPWELLDAGWHFLERWEAAAPLWRYGVLAADIGTKDERKRTEALTLDLRILPYAAEMLFVRKCEAGERLLAEWLGERAGNAEPRLAFLRALCRVKPLFLALPRSWLGNA